MEIHTQEKLIEMLDGIRSAIQYPIVPHNPDLGRIATALENINSHIFLLTKTTDNINLLAGYVLGRLLNEEEKSKAAATGGFE